MDDRQAVMDEFREMVMNVIQEQMLNKGLIEGDALSVLEEIIAEVEADGFHV